MYSVGFSQHFADLLNLSDGVKMSKSQNNVLTIKEFLESHTADEFRMLCTISSYRNGNIKNLFDFSL